jgi:hypothetical protein
MSDDNSAENPGRWKKGQSGNPNGRPPASKWGLADLAKLMMDQPILIESGGEKVSATRMQKVVIELVERADQGDMASLRILLGELRRWEREEWHYERMAFQMAARAQAKPPARRKETPTQRRARQLQREHDEKFLQKHPEFRASYEEKWARQEAEANGEVYKQNMNTEEKEAGEKEE